ncbi:MAG: metal-dependent hydrolase, partial [Acidobacteriota bacterium]
MSGVSRTVAPLYTRSLDNITHSLIGAAIGELVQPAGATAVERRTYLGTAVLAAILPDLDLLYTGITPAPLGYLLHHRGHTHTVAGLFALGILTMLLCWSVPAVRRLARADRRTLWAVVWINLIGHVGMDALNSYGVHPFYPFDSRWYFGDAVFIFEPLLWGVLGAAAMINTVRRRVRQLIGALIATLFVVVGALGVVPLLALTGIGGASVLLTTATRNRPGRVRSAVALAASAVFIVTMLGLSRVARAAVLAAVAPDRRGLVADIILTPDPGVPACWTALVVENDEGAGEFVLRRATLSIFPSIQLPGSCRSRRFMRAGASDALSTRSSAWSDAIRQPLASLRDLNDRGCWVRAWLQFGRAPVLGDG